LLRSTAIGGVGVDGQEAVPGVQQQRFPVVQRVLHRMPELALRQRCGALLP
jgi:hypothetical protein